MSLHIGIFYDRTQKNKIFLGSERQKDKNRYFLAVKFASKSSLYRDNAIKNHWARTRTWPKNLF
ncbi:hypothetical protein A7Q09_07230 [Methylacidiphilum sp. Yel]|nr:hypothetical protein A7Q09_07230 [Methylacidiphilum sp. Yel]